MKAIGNIKFKRCEECLNVLGTLNTTKLLRRKSGRIYFCDEFCKENYKLKEKPLRYCACGEFAKIYYNDKGHIKMYNKRCINCIKERHGKSKN